LADQSQVAAAQVSQLTKIATIQLLLIEDNLGDARLLREMLNEPQSRHIKLTHAECMRDAENLITDQVFDVVLLDPGLPDTQGLDSIRRAKATAQNVPLVVLTGHDDDELASLALHEGAQDYLVKNEITPRGLQRALRYAIERQIMKESLFIEKERAQVTLNCIGDAVISTDDSRNVTFLNSVAEQLTGWSQKDAQGRHITEVAQIIYETSVERLPNLIGMEEGKSPAFSFPNSALIRRDGVSIPIEESVGPIHDREGQRSGSVIIFRDVSAARALSLQIIHSAEHDFLTDLPNRMLFIDRVSQAIAMATRQTRQIAILFLDLDGFKHINDSLGHSIGDHLLKSVSKRLVGCARVTDTVSRQGGDEFVVLLSEVDEAEDAALAARRMLEEVSKPHIIEQHTLDITTSIGISIYPDDGRDAETLIKNADTAMYQAKEDGRRGFKFFKSAMNVRAVERQSIEQDLRHALDRQEFSLHYQPKIDLKTGAITGAEALLRWTHPTRGPVSPETFISIAEDCGLIVPIGNWVLREACSQTVSWLAAGLPSISIAVNVSALQFRHENFAKNLFTILSDTGMDPRSLEIELTESVLMKHADTAADILRNLRDSGIRIAIDDFGTGYSSLSYLQRFPVDTLKIDQSFVRQITTVGADTAIVSAVLSMARILEMRVVAEGVETVEALTFLQSQRCDEAQGYYFSRPVIASQFATLLSTGIPKALGLRGVSGIGIGRSKSKPDTPWRDLLANAGGNSHIVQLYQDDESCGDAISHFAAEGIIRGDSIILVHTKPHWEIISHRLSSRPARAPRRARRSERSVARLVIAVDAT
jgi:diguanylate cyclase (GGDEF)-like protein/PAS domain S-box-containing protein